MKEVANDFISTNDKHMWQSRVEIEDYSALAKNELVMLIEALGRPQLFAEVLALIVAWTSSYAHESAVTSGVYTVYARGTVNTR